MVHVERRLKRLVDFKQPVKVERVVGVHPPLVNLLQPLNHVTRHRHRVVNNDAIAIARLLAQRQANEMVDFLKIVARRLDRKSTRLNSSHVAISYAVFCLKKKKKNNNMQYRPKRGEQR